MSKRIYIPKGICSKVIFFDVENNKVRNVEFIGGCDGNSKGISKLVEGMEVGEVISKLKGVKCGSKTSSCPDQLALALNEIDSDNWQPIKIAKSS